MKLPESMDDLIYFTRRTIDDGRIVCWVEKKECPKCHKGLMGKPVEKGKVKIRAKEYTCMACGYTEPKEEHELTLDARAIYTCPSCKKEGEGKVQFKRKTIKGAPTLRFNCEHCSADLDVTKKFKEQKKKK